jgi:hypothetical protein
MFVHVEQIIHWNLAIDANILIVNIVLDRMNEFFCDI